MYPNSERIQLAVSSEWRDVVEYALEKQQLATDYEVQDSVLEGYVILSIILLEAFDSEKVSQLLEVFSPTVLSVASQENVVENEHSSLVNRLIEQVLSQRKTISRRDLELFCEQQKIHLKGLQLYHLPFTPSGELSVARVRELLQAESASELRLLVDQQSGRVQPWVDMPPMSDQRLARIKEIVIEYLLSQAKTA